MAETTQTTEQPATTPPGVVQHTDDAPSPAAAAGKPLEKGGKGKATVRTRYPFDLFEHSVKGVEPITAAGTEVDRSKLSSLLKAADEAGADLEEVEDA